MNVCIHQMMDGLWNAGDHFRGLLHIEAAVTTPDGATVKVGRLLFQLQACCQLAIMETNDTGIRWKQNLLSKLQFHFGQSHQ